MFSARSVLHCRRVERSRLLGFTGRFRDNEIFEDLKRSIQEDERPKEEQRQALLYELNSTGKYFAFKEQLKHSVIKIVREKYLQTTNFTSQQQLQVLYTRIPYHVHVWVQKMPM